MSLSKQQKKIVVRGLKVSRYQNAGQLLSVLAYRAHAYPKEVSSYLQTLKSEGLVSYIPTTKVWYWNEPVDYNELIRVTSEPSAPFTKTDFNNLVKLVRKACGVPRNCTTNIAWVSPVDAEKHNWNYDGHDWGASEGYQFFDIDNPYPRFSFYYIIKGEYGDLFDVCYIPFTIFQILERGLDWDVEFDGVIRTPKFKLK